MTIICAMHEAGVGTWIASDSLVTSNDIIIGQKQKWIIGNGCAIAGCGSNAVSELLAEHASEFKPDWTPTAFFRWFKPLLDAHGFKPKAEEGGTPWYDCSFLLATPRGVLSLDSAGGGVRFGDRQFASRGSGADVADGAAWVLNRQAKSPHEVLSEAVKAAIAHITSCGGEVWIDCLKIGR